MRFFLFLFGQKFQLWAKVWGEICIFPCGQQIIPARPSFLPPAIEVVSNQAGKKLFFEGISRTCAFPSFLPTKTRKTAKKSNKIYFCVCTFIPSLSLIAPKTLLIAHGLKSMAQQMMPWGNMQILFCLRQKVSR